MKKITAVLVMSGVAMSCPAFAENSLGSNPDGSEKVCALGASVQNEAALEEALKRCKRGDILDSGWLKITMAMQLCDFTKTIVYHPPTGAIAACVYTGNRRGTSR